jgi:hypothetical protein
MFLRTYSKWLDGADNDREMQRLEEQITPESHRKSLKSENQ